MNEDKIYTKVLDYMCHNYDYNLYANDFTTSHIKSLQRAIASIPTPANTNRIIPIKLALQDFFAATFQNIILYEDNENVKVVKYFDKGIHNEEEDRLLHELRLKLLQYKDEVQKSFKAGNLYIFANNIRSEFEQMLSDFSKTQQKELLRNQIRLVFDMSDRDMIVFLNEKIFLKEFVYVKESFLHDTNYSHLLQEEYFLNSLWEEVQKKLNDVFKESFIFFEYSPKYFYDNYYRVMLLVIEKLFRRVFSDMQENILKSFTNEIASLFEKKMLLECVKYLLKSITLGSLRANEFLKFYSNSTHFKNNKIALKRAPLMDKAGNIYDFKYIFSILKEKEFLVFKIKQKEIEIKKVLEKVNKALKNLRANEEVMRKLQKQYFIMLEEIKRVDKKITNLREDKSINDISCGRLEFTKRDLLDDFNKIQIKLKTQENIVKNNSRDLEKWDEKKHEKILNKEQMQEESYIIDAEYRKICLLLTEALQKEPYIL